MNNRVQFQMRTEPYYNCSQQQPSLKTEILLGPPYNSHWIEYLIGETFVAVLVVISPRKDIIVRSWGNKSHFLLFYQK